ncbi:LamG-like jellyroll fold domain-containing protein [Portibacter lacus]|uniref:LTD domain-containing protein n=1 Tax=Portibacter lacus TaxID=1099794 RepID=A0AA37SRL2_9BACT|nr:LamG-like jellyroll fold domain-containing protein [Portibacter lacus]GLR19591.1 hypothetical protein GCM10007940_42070 [Portibacter lacus]
MKIKFNIAILGSFFFILSNMTFAQTLDWVGSIAGGQHHVEPNAIATDINGDILLGGNFRETADFDFGVGITSFTSVGDRDGFLAKYSNSGNLIWVFPLGSTSATSSLDTRVYDITSDSGGNIIIVGEFKGNAINFAPNGGTSTLLTSSNSGISSSAFVAKYSSLGACIWAFGLGENNNNELYAVEVDDSDNIYIGGRLDDNAGTLDVNPLGNVHVMDTDGADAVLIKYDTNGEHQWDINIGNPNNNDYVYGIEIVNSKVYLSGRFQGTCEFNPLGTSIAYTSSGSYDAFIAEYNTVNGICNWANAIGGSGSDESRESSVDSDGNVYVAGSFSSTVDFDPSAAESSLTSNGSIDIFVVKYNSIGGHEWSFSLGGTSIDNGLAMDIDGTHVFVTGRFRGTVDFDPSVNTFNLIGQGGATKDEIFLATYDLSGDFKQAFSVEGSDSDRGTGIVAETDKVYLTGYFEDANVDFDPIGTNVLSSAGGTQYHDGFLASYTFSFNAKVAVSEWISNPLGVESDAEWIEIHNYGATAVNLKDWKLKDEDTDDSVISTDDLFLDSGESLILANNKLVFESQWMRNCSFDQVVEVDFELDNEADEIILEDKLGNTIWSLAYLDDETEGVATFYSDLTYDITSFGSKASPGVSRTANDVSGTLGYQSNNITNDVNSFKSTFNDMGSPIHQQLAGEERGNSVYLDGVDGHIDLGATMELENQSQFTFEAWIKPITIDEGSERIFSKRLDNINRIEILLGNGGGEADNQFVQISICSGLSETASSPNLSVPVGAWTHIAITFDGGASAGNRLKFYANGIVQHLSSDPTATVTPMGNGNAHIGKRSDNTNKPSNIELDEIRLWNTKRTELSIRENMHLTLAGCEAGLVSYYQLNELSSVLVEDVRDNNEATLEGGVSRTLSGVNVGNSILSFSQTIANISSVGVQSFDSANVEINITSISNAQDLTTTFQSFSSNTIDGADGVLFYDNPTWTINSSSSDTEYVGDLKFALPSGSLTSNDPLNYRLYQRTSYEEGQWTSIANASQISNDSITFSNIESLGQFMIVQQSVDGVSPVRGNMYSFDGIDDYIDLGNGNEFDIAGEITVESWVKMNGVAGTQHIVSKSDSGIESSYLLELLNGDPQFSVRLGSVWQTATAGITLTADEWYHIAGVYDGTTIQMYINGVLQNSLAAAGNIEVSTSTVQLGGSSSGNNLNGAMDEIRIWSTGRSQKELRENMHLTLKGNEGDLAAYYQFNSDNNTGSIGGVKDALDGNDGTTFNMDGSTYEDSEVAIGGGISSSVTIPSIGPFIAVFQDVGLTASFVNIAADGEIVAYRIQTESPSGASSIGGEVDNEYFIIRNYGINSSFSELNQFSLFNIGYIDPVDAALPEATTPLFLYKRAANEYGNTWGTKVASANSAVEGHRGSLSFDNSAGITDFGQFVFVKDGPLCDIEISGSIVLPESCPDVEDGSIAISALCPSCTGIIEYSKDNGSNFQSTPSFTELPSATYEILIRDTENLTCSATSTLTVNPGMISMVWNGNAGDGLWTNAGNWSLGIVPSSCHDVVISNGDMVTLSGISTSVTSITTSNNSELIISPSASLFINID